MKNNNRLLSLVIILISITCSCLNLHASTKTEIRSEIINSFKLYEEFYKNNELLKATEEIKKAYNLSNEHFPDTKLTAELIYNYTLVMYQSMDYDSEIQRRKLYKLLYNCVSIFTNVYGENAVELVDPYMLKANYSLRSFYYRLRTFEAYNKAFDIAKLNENKYPLLLPDLYLEAGINLYKNQFELKTGRDLLEQALGIYKSHFGKFTEQSASASLWLAKYFYEANSDSKSKQYLNTVIDYHKNTQTEYHPRLIQAYALLIEIFESDNDVEMANYYSRAIGESRPWNDEQEAFPIYMPAIEANRNNAGMRVTFSLHISENGQVLSAEVKDTNGNKKHAERIKKYIFKWRFSPKFEDGKAVDSYSDFTFTVGKPIKPML